MTDKEIKTIRIKVAGLKSLAEMVAQRCLEIEKTLPPVSTEGSKKTKEQQLEAFKNDPRFIKIMERRRRNRNKNHIHD